MAKFDVYYGEPEDRDARIGGTYDPEQDSWAEYVIELTDEEFLAYEATRREWDYWQGIIARRIVSQ